MKLQRLISLLAVLLLAEIASVVVAVAATTNTTDFIRTSCSATSYQDVCFSSLSGYANAVKNDPARLARVSIRVSMKNAKSMAKYLSNLSRQVDYSSDRRVAAAVHDCVSVFGDAVDKMRASEKQMKSLGTGTDLKFHMSNVQTWMSAALTNEDTCVDGFEGVTENPVKTDVSDRVTKAKKFTSNALDLINRYAKSVTTP